jgi:hypothetical protein
LSLKLYRSCAIPLEQSILKKLYFN